MNYCFTLEESGKTSTMELTYAGKKLVIMRSGTGLLPASVEEDFDSDEEADIRINQLKKDLLSAGYTEKHPPFPFFGAGYGHYYEWAEIIIRFKRIPTDEEKTEIINLAPAPIKPDMDSFSGKMLMAGSEQFVNMYIHDTYECPGYADKVIEKVRSESSVFDCGCHDDCDCDDEDCDCCDDDCDCDCHDDDCDCDCHDQNRECRDDDCHCCDDDCDCHDEDDALSELFYASEAALDAFESHIERWIELINDICPVEYVFRREDWEAGGTDLSWWHHVSLNLINDLIPLWDNPGNWQMEGKEEELFIYSISQIFNYIETPFEGISSAFMNRFFADVKLGMLLEKDDLTEAEEWYKTHKSNPDVVEMLEMSLVSEIEDGNHEKAVEIFRMAINELAVDYNFMLQMAGPVMLSLIQTGNIDLSEEFVEKLSDQMDGYGDTASNNYANNIGATAYKIMREDFNTARQLFRLACEIRSPEPPKHDLSLFCNALWVLQKDNTGLEVNSDLNKYFLNKCLPHAPNNPAVYFNAACLYVEMDDFENAAECIRKAIEHHYDGIEMMFTQVDAEPMFKDFRNSDFYKSLKN